jgi:hypothetical protein
MLVKIRANISYKLFRAELLLPVPKIAARHDKRRLIMRACHYFSRSFVRVKPDDQIIITRHIPRIFALPV